MLGAKSLVRSLKISEKLGSTNGKHCWGILYKPTTAKNNKAGYRVAHA
jgi:hypothetical protein